MGKIDDFREERERLNRLLLERSNTDIKRLLNLDTQVYQDGALPKKTKEMLGLVSSIVLRCDDCINHHLIRCKEEGVTDEELVEILAVGSLVGGSVTIPHIRLVIEAWDEISL
jgi:AhpD family alkylhydroperoxidase